MTSVQGRGCPCREHFSIAPSDSSSPPMSEFFKYPAKPPGPKSPTTATDVLKYSKDNLKRIFKAVLEAWAFAPVSALAASEEPRKKLLKACFLDIYCGRFYINCYNFCQQSKDYFTTVGAIGANKILFAAFFLRDRTNFR